MEAKKYQHIEDDGLMLNEPMPAYSAATEAVSPTVGGNTTEYDEELPAEYIRMALECALDDEKNGRLIPNDKVMDVIRERLGWK